MSARSAIFEPRDDEDVLTGVTFPDPYRWLESDSAEVQQWQHQQDELIEHNLGSWPYHAKLRQLVAKFNTPRFAELPEWAAGSWFRKHTRSGTSGAQVIVSDEPLGEGQTLFDSVEDDAQQSPHISWIAPAPDGMTLALGLCTDGSEQNTIRLIDVTTGNVLADSPDQVLMDNWTCGVTWLPDSSGFYFSAIEGSPTAFNQQIFFHSRGTRPQTVKVNTPEPEEPDYRVVTVSDDGRIAILLEGISHPRPIALANLKKPESPEWLPFVTDFEGSVAGHPVNDEYVAVVTAPHTPRGKVVAIELREGAESKQWRTVVPQSNAVIQSVQPVGDRLFVTEMVNTYARIRIFSMGGEELGEIPLPGHGTVGTPPFAMLGAVRRAHPQDLLLAFSSLTSSWVRYRYVATTGTLEPLDEPEAILENAVVEDRWATAPDGKPVPYHIVHRRDTPIDSPQPTLVSGYGGFNIPWVPQFPGTVAAFVEAGGVFIHTHLRGGSDLGRDWWQQGRMQFKQNGLDDLYAIAEDLIQSGATNPELLSFTGGSNGGLMAGAAITQRPDLWRAVVPRVPILDLIGACRDAYGLMAVSQEYADVSDPNEVRRLAKFSPYQLVTDGVDYPSVYVVAGATDPRCPAWHARKFVARLQGTGSKRPVLLRVWEDSGHGAANSKENAITADTEWLAFIFRELGMELR